MSLRFACVSALLLAACGGSSSDPVLQGDPTSPASSSDGGIETDASTPPPSSSPDSGVDASTKDTRIDPIDVGHSWTWNVTVLGFYPSCDNGQTVSTVLSERMLDGKKAVDLQSLCTNAGVFTYSVDGDRVYSYWDNAWHVALDAPVADGHSWTDDYADFEWKAEGTLKTAIGTFDECYSAKKKVSYPYYTTFCRGVGPVRWHFEDGFGNGYDATIIGKNF